MSSAIVSAMCIEEFQWEEMVSVASTVCRTRWQGISRITKILSMTVLTFPEHSRPVSHEDQFWSQAWFVTDCWQLYGWPSSPTPVCLLSLPGHTDVLHGILQDSPPIIRPRLVSQALSRDTMSLTGRLMSSVFFSEICLFTTFGTGRSASVVLKLWTLHWRQHFSRCRKSVPMTEAAKIDKVRDK